MDIRESPKRWAILATLCTGTFIAAFYISVVIVALPSIMRHFDISLTLTAWVMLVYTLGLTAFLLPFGRLSDIFGRKRIYFIGCIVFTIATAMAGLSQNIWQLLSMRLLEALGAAMIMANSFAIIATIFPPRDLGKAMGFNGAVASLGVSLAPLLGGLMVNNFSWRAIFFFNIPFGIAVTILAGMILKEEFVSPNERGNFSGFDFPGVLAVATMLSSFQLGLSSGQTGHWSSLPTLLAFTVTAASILFFFFWESHFKNPLVPLSLFRIRPFSAGVLSRMLYFLSYATSYLMVSYFLQIPLGYSALQAGFLMVPTGLSQAIFSPVSGWLSDKLGYRIVAVIGMLISALAMLGLSRLSLSVSYGEVLLWLVLVGVGQGIFQTPNISLIMGTAPRENYAVAGALSGVIREVGYAIGIGLSTTILVSTLISQTGVSFTGDMGSQLTGPEREGFLRAFMVGYRRIYVGAALMCLVVAAVSLVRTPAIKRK